MNHKNQHNKWMTRAIQLAEKGRRTASPNPLVGACVVRKNRLVGQGYHRFYGGDHAEVAALKDAGTQARGATLYVTLEPCSTFGQTPPCVDAILQAGIREVMVGCLDPNPVHHRKGVQILKRKGLSVKTGFLSPEIEKQNDYFFKWVRQKMPFVTLKMAQSLDGKIATFEGRSRWISSKGARKFVHELRSEHDAILVGKKTLMVDDPFLNPRLRVPNADEVKPWRIVIDPRFEVRPDARIFKGKQLTFIAVSEKILKKKTFRAKKMRPAVIVLPIPEYRGRLDLRILLKRLASLGVAKLLCEGGGELAWSLLEAGLVDRVHWIIAPKFIGGRDAKTSVEGKGFRLPSQAIPCDIENVEKLGEDILVTGSA